MYRQIIARLDKQLTNQLFRHRPPIIVKHSRSILPNFTLPNCIERSLSSLYLVNNLLDLVQTKYIHMTSIANREIGYDEFLTLRTTGLTIIDVRESDEIKASGSVPGSFNVPSQQVEGALKKHPEEFKSMYGRSKPKENDKILFYCQRGLRSKKAMEKAIQMGFINSVSLKGGWEEFSKNSN